MWHAADEPYLCDKKRIWGYGDYGLWSGTDNHDKQTVSRQSERNSIMKCLNCGETEAAYQ
jgi:hypothetical protein